jgi:hypothetical protein
MACSASADVKSREQLALPSTTRQIPCLHIVIFVNENRRLLRRSRHRCARADKKLLRSHMLPEIAFAGRELTATLPRAASCGQISRPKSASEETYSRSRRRAARSRSRRKPEREANVYIPSITCLSRRL